jgi:ubiquinone/menaquinone biosynthesis C-methylase UbiE
MNIDKILLQSTEKNHIPKNEGSSKQMISHYEIDAEVTDYYKPRVDNATAHEYIRLQEKIVSNIDEKSQIILDIGCGRAWVASRLLPRNQKVISFDVAPINVEKALSTYPHDNHFGVIGDGLCLPFIDNCIDIVVCSEVLEHVEKPSQLIREITRVLKANGKAIITTPFNEIIQNHLCIHCNKPTPSHAHLHSFDLKTIIEEVPSGMQSVTTTTFSSKLLSRLRTHIVLKYFTFSLWTIVDKFMLKLFGRAERLMLIIVK